MKILLLLMLVVGFSYADNIIDNPELLYQAPISDNSLLSQKVTVNWKFVSFEDFIQTLQKNYGIKSKTLSVAQDLRTPVLLYLDKGSLSDLIKQACDKFGYSWLYKDEILIFRAINPKVVSMPAKNLVESSANVAVWSLAPEDRSLRTALNRWCKKAKWQLVWNVKADYPITTSWNISGSFESAVNEVLRASQDTDMPLQATMYDSNHVLEIGSPIVVR